MTRSAKDYAIEHGEYLATAVEEYIKLRCVCDAALEECAELPDELSERLSDHFSGLSRDVYEFRKRAERAKKPRRRGK